MSTRRRTVPVPAVVQTSQEIIRSTPWEVPGEIVLPDPNQHDSAAPRRLPSQPITHDKLPQPQRRGDSMAAPPRKSPSKRKQDFECPKSTDYKSVNELGVSIAAEGDLFPQECPLEDLPEPGRLHAPLTFAWKASALCHKPLYFEEVALERYGHTRRPLLQPAISGVKFLASIPVLPYKMGLETPNECLYTLGYYRPGSCAPFLRYRIPWQRRAATFQAIAVTGLVFLIP